MIGRFAPGLWAYMDTFTEKQALEEMYPRGETPWEIWRPGATDPT